MIVNKCLLIVCYTVILLTAKGRNTYNESMSTSLEIFQTDSIYRRLFSLSEPIVNIPEITLSDMRLIYDPPNNHFSPTALGVYVEVIGQPDALVYYSFTGSPTLSDSVANITSPYISVMTPFGANRRRSLWIVAVIENSFGQTVRSEQYHLTYDVEALNRPLSYGFLVPGIETSGYFLRVTLEEVATQRAQQVGSQEFADFYNRGSKSTLGTYATQIQELHLPSIDPDLNGFEGGYAVNISNGRYFGILVPYHNGKAFFGKVVRIDLIAMANASSCAQSFRTESIGQNGDIIRTGNTSDPDACVVVLDLSTLHKNARGFRRGFVGYPYAYLSPAEFSIIVRLDMENFTISNTLFIDLSLVNSTYGGFSGGFVDGTWACFNPFRTFYGPVGGLRSTLPVDKNQLRAYYHGNMVCVNSSAWENELERNTSIITLNPANISPDYRGFSDAIRVGRYAYLCPYATDNHVYTGKLLRIYLGSIDIGTQLQALSLAGLPLSTIVDQLDLTQVNASYAGFSSIITSGSLIFLVPYRNSYTPFNGQRGHGNVVRLDMNNFGLKGVTGLDLTVNARYQIPSFPDTDLRGFSYGFASGRFAIFVPFYSGIFSGKAARIQMYGSSALAGDLQELDLSVDRLRPSTYKGFRGGFVSIWPGTTS